MKDRFDDWLAARSPRERILLAVLASCLAAYFFYAVLLAPAVNGRAAAAAALPGKARQLAVMQAQAQDAQRLRPRASRSVPSGDGLRDALQAALVARAIAGGEVSSGSDGVRVQLKNVAFGQFVGWLDDVRLQYRVRLAEAQFTTFDDPDRPGRVDVNATLRPAGAP
ncbi:type II secretion system protein GspM [Chitinasiproducens palmae]|uniref:General secretion pathway protein M n=1 Tax=Chitinasiproducens palmae TaxID=1770053 RepID=A0A1H2PQ54_9BURK|nr:type II secretion system protein M [Chitinasiproducens palmae]SDV48478.1 general secretion pathway protein M [Chitinasiproducens palmae]